MADRQLQNPAPLLLFLSGRRELIRQQGNIHRPPVEVGNCAALYLGSIALNTSINPSETHSQSMVSK